MLACVLVAPGVAKAGRCEELARPTTFDSDSAMEAVFCEYDRAHHGTLLPLRATTGWRVRGAEQLLTPHLVSTFVEGGVRKGVLVVQRQSLTAAGEVENGLAAQVDLSVYLFRFDGTRWVFEKGNKSATRSGRHGLAQPVHLIKLGADAFGLIIPEALGNRGLWYFDGAIISLSEGPVRQVGQFSLGADNSGSCGPVEGTPTVPCYASKGALEFLEDAKARHWLLRHRVSGTELKDSGGTATPVDSAKCFRLGAPGIRGAGSSRMRRARAELRADHLRGLHYPG